MSDNTLQLDEKTRGKDGKFYSKLSQSSQIYQALRHIGKPVKEAYTLATGNNNPHKTSINKAESRYQASLLTTGPRLKRAQKKIDQIMLGHPNVFKDKDKKEIKVEYPTLKLQSEIAMKTIEVADGRSVENQGAGLHPVDISIYLAPQPQDVVIEGESEETP